MTTARPTPSTCVLLLAVAAFLLLFLVYPVAHSAGAAFVHEGKPSLLLAKGVLDNPLYRDSLTNSFKVALATTFLALLFSLPPAYLLARVRLRGKTLLNALLLVPLVLPPFVGAIGVRQILSRYGLVNAALLKLHLIRDEIDWLAPGSYAFWLVVVMEALHLYPILYLNLAAAWANLDPSMEEAAECLGARPLRLFRTVTFPLLSPGLFAGGIIVFIWSFTDLGTPLLFNYTELVPVQVFNSLQDQNSNPAGHVLAVLVLVITSICFALSRWLVGRQHLEMSGRALAATREHTLSISMLTLTLLPVLLLVCLALVPHLTVLLASLAKDWGMDPLPEWRSDPHLLGNYVEVFRSEQTARAIRISVLCSVASTAVDLLLGFAVAYVLCRQRFLGRGLLDTVTMLPLAIPGVVLAFGYVGAFSGTALDPRDNPIPLLIISYAVRRLPFSVRSVMAGLQQTHPSLEEASLNLGASRFHTVRKITLPLVAANLIAAGIMVFAFSMLEVSDSLILALKEEYSPITKAIFDLTTRPGDGPFVASAMGVLGMVLLAATFLLAARLLGKRMGELFRA